MREFLDNLEELISQEAIRKVNALFLLILFSVIFAIYYFFIDPKITELSQKQETLLSLEQKITKILPKTWQSKIEFKKREMLKNKNSKEKLRLKVLSLKSKLDSLNFSFVDPVGFSNFLNYLLKKSISNNLLIQNIKIMDQKKPFLGKLYMKKTINVVGTGRFLNIIKFVRELENQKKLFSLKDFNIETNGTLPNFNFKIDFYGVKN